MPFDDEPPLTPAPAPAVRTFTGRVRYGAALLSALVPGLGQVAIGRRRRALPFLVPVLVALLALVVLLLTRPIISIAATFADPDVVGLVLVIELVVLAVRVVAVGGVLVDGRFPRLRPRDALPIALLAALVVLPQAGLAAWTQQLQQTDQAVFGPSIGDDGVDDNAPFPTFPVITPVPDPSGSDMPSGSPFGSPSASPSPTPPRITILLIGVDSGVGRNTALTDTMIVASLDPVGKTVSMVSVPRDMVDVPLATGGDVPSQDQRLVSDVRWHPARTRATRATDARCWPARSGGCSGSGSTTTPRSTSAASSRSVNARRRRRRQRGPRHVRRELRRVRLREQSLQHRGRPPPHERQPGPRLRPDPQVGRRERLHPRRPPAAGHRGDPGQDRVRAASWTIRSGCCKAIGNTIRTNVPPKILPDLAPLASQIGAKDTYQAVISYPMVHPSAGYDPRGSIQIPDLKAIAALGQRMFTPAGDHAGRQVRRAGADEGRQGPGGAGPGLRSNPHSTPKPTPEADAQADEEAEPEPQLQPVRRTQRLRQRRPLDRALT